MKPDEFLYLLLTELREAVRHEALPAGGACHTIIWYGYEFEDFTPSPATFHTKQVALERFKQLYMQWPGFSGNPEYPVPAPTSAGSSASKFDRARMWYHGCTGGDRWTGEYGRLRMEMIDFVIEQLEKELA